jgi:glycosyltransferase involved in cell wall biosynthesis
MTTESSIERRQYLKELLQSAQEVLTVSSSFAELYKKNGINEISVTPNGVSDDLPWAPKDTSHTKKVVCGHIGSMAEHKGYYLLKEAALVTQPENIEFLIVDHSKEEGYEHHASWGTVPVTFIGRVSQDRIVELYRRIDVLFAPSTWPESFGLVTREAAECGCWVVASNMGGIGEDIIIGESGFVIEPSSPALAKALSDISKHSQMFKQPIRRHKRRLAKDQVHQLAPYYLTDTNKKTLLN